MLLPWDSTYLTVGSNNPKIHFSLGTLLPVFFVLFNLELNHPKILLWSFWEKKKCVKLSTSFLELKRISLLDWNWKVNTLEFAMLASLATPIKSRHFMWFMLSVCSSCFATKVNPSHIYATRYCNVQLFELWLPWDPWRRKRVSKAVQASLPSKKLVDDFTHFFFSKSFTKVFLDGSTKDWREREEDWKKQSPKGSALERQFVWTWWFGIFYP